MRRKDFRTLVNREYSDQDHEFDSQHEHHYWLGLVMEEVGEAAQNLNKGQSPLKELVQVAALIESWIENIDTPDDWVIRNPNWLEQHNELFEQKIGRPINLDD